MVLQSPVTESHGIETGPAMIVPINACAPVEAHVRERSGSFRKLGVPYVGVLTVRILLFRLPY